MGRGKQYSHQEDEQLSRSWVHVSVDPIKGKDQTSVDFWNSVEEHFKNSLSTPLLVEERNSRSLKNRFKTISRDVSKFSGLYCKVKALNESGKTDEDIVEDAVKLYAESQGSPFTFLGCWRVLSKMPKFKATPTTEFSGATPRKVTRGGPDEDEDSGSSSSIEVTSNDTSSPHAESSDNHATKKARIQSTKRPPGNKKSKSLLEEANNLKSMRSSVDKISEMSSKKAEELAKMNSLYEKEIKVNERYRLMKFLKGREDEDSQKKLKELIDLSYQNSK